MTRTKKQRGGQPPDEDAELRQRAAEWVCAIRATLTALTQEVEAVNRAATDGTPLARVINTAALSEVYHDLYNADCAAGNLGTVLEHGLPVPNLLGSLTQLTNSKGGA